MKAIVFYGSENKALLCTVENKYNDNFLEPNKFYEIKELYTECILEQCDYITRSVGFTNVIDSYVVPITDIEFDNLLDFRNI